MSSRQTCATCIALQPRGRHYHYSPAVDCVHTYVIGSAYTDGVVAARSSYAGGVSDISRWQAPNGAPPPEPAQSNFDPSGVAFAPVAPLPGCQTGPSRSRWRHAFGICHRLMSDTPPAYDGVARQKRTRRVWTVARTARRHRVEVPRFTHSSTTNSSAIVCPGLTR